MAEIKRVQREHLAMATQFEIVLYGQNEQYLTTVAEEVMREIDRLEAQLSFYRSDSDIRQINACAAYGPVSLDPRVFRLLERAQKLNALTEGTFDITVAPLMRCWGFVGAGGQMPTAEAIEAARSKVGMQHIVLDADACTIAFDCEGVEVDLGAIGKGYAIERAVELLREFEIESALLHGGTSAVYALGAPPNATAWQVALQRPQRADDIEISEKQAGDYLAVVEMCDVSLSVSAPHGKWFASEGRRYGHVIDPRTGYPTSRGLLSAIVMHSATDGDALSTGLLTLGASFLPRLRAFCPEVRAVVVSEDENKDEIENEGLRITSEGINIRMPGTIGLMDSSL